MLCKCISDTHNKIHKFPNPHYSSATLKSLTQKAENQILGHYDSFPGGSDGKESTCNAEDPGSIPELERSPGEGNGYPLQYSCLEDTMDRGAWRATVHGVPKNRI